jgi:two-component system response regulator FixJ
MISLSPGERPVLEGIVAGKANKAIAYDLNISVRTVEVGRTRMLFRPNTHSIAEAIRHGVLGHESLLLATGSSRPVWIKIYAINFYP